MAVDNKDTTANRLLDIVLNDINGVKRGKSKPDEIRIGRLGEIKSLNIPAIPTGSLALDLACGVGGVPEGRIVEIFGPESCIYRDSYVSFEIWSADNKERINHKGGTIGRLYERFHDTTIDGMPKQGRHLQTKKITKFFVKSVNDEGSIVRNEILDVVKTGEKECYSIAIQNGNSLIATGEHKFLTPKGYKPLDELSIGDTVFVHNNTRRKGRKDYANRPEVMVKYHPHWPTKVVRCDKTQKDYTYYRGQKSRAVFEAYLNDMSLEEYLKVLNTQSKSFIDTLQFLSQDIHIHHIDEDFNNNEAINLLAINSLEHGKLHAKDKHANVIVPSEIVTKELVGLRETYDLKCAFPYNNYIAEGIVVHNSGKTTLCLHAIAEAQKLGHKCAFIDVEHTLDPTYAKAIGVNIDQLIFAQPNSGNEAMQWIDRLVRTGAVKVIVIDSIAALTTEAELEGNIDKTHVGQQARLMSQALKVLTTTTGNSGTTLLFTNQIRMKIGTMYGNPETTPGGEAMKFYASQRWDVRRREPIKEAGKVVGAKTRVKIVKNKVAAPFKEAYFEIIYGVGINQEKDVVQTATEVGIVDRAGAWYSFDGEQIGQGIDNAAAYLIDRPEQLAEVRKKVLQVVRPEAEDIEPIEEEE